jgi:hypothetical protein
MGYDQLQKCHIKIVVVDQLCSRLVVINHLDEEKIVNKIWATQTK